MSMGDAFALGLGRLSVQSALGEGLRAEIDVTSISPEEAASLRARVAPPDAYRAAGAEYNAALPAAQVSLHKRPDGRSYLRIRSDRAVQEPFVDLILELSWASGRLVRDYTLLFDPPASPAPLAPQPLTAPVIAQQQPAAASQPASPAADPAGRHAETAPRRAEAAGRAASPAPANESAAAERVAVRPGDSLTRIAGRVQQPGVSLDQIVVSLYRANPQAFAGDNMNRLKAGSVLTVPQAEQAQAVTVGEARRLIRAQSADFDAYRQRVAAAAAGGAADESGRQSSGRVEAAVEDRKSAAAPTTDRLTLSKGALKAERSGAPAPEEGIAKQREQQEAGTRVAELSRNIEELKRLQAPAGAPAAPAASAPASGPSLGLPVPLAVPAAEPASAPASAVAAMPAASALASAAPSKLESSNPGGARAGQETPPAPQAEAAADEPSAFDLLMEDPMVLPVAAGLVVLLGGLGAYRFARSRRKTKDSAETSFLESRLQPDSFFGATGGGRVDTSSTPPSPSLSYSLSQIDAIGDVDPVAEADVYLAYGRDLQAEEILKEAMRTDPDRLAIRLKMLEVYAKRRDTRGFEVLATQLRSVTGGEGEDWAKACELGRSIDPNNPLYQTDARTAPREPAFESVAVPEIPAVAPVAAAAAVSAAPLAAQVAGNPDLDLDLSEPLDAPAAMGDAFNLEATRPLPSGGPVLPEFASLDLPPQPAPAVPAPAVADTSMELEGLSFDLSEDLPAAPPPAAAPAPAAAPVAAAPAPAPAPAGDTPLEFDLGGLTLDFDMPASGSAPAAASPSELGSLDTLDGLDMMTGDEEGGDPLARKFELADEFMQIGDYEGARELLREVAAHAQGPLKAKAQGLLDEMA
nr:FimV/HubP family polar landmark protein [Caldimonas tepidiphila]